MKSNYSILCIDDDPNILDIVTQNLQEYDLFAITNPLEGFKILKSNPEKIDQIVNRLTVVEIYPLVSQ